MGRRGGSLKEERRKDGERGVVSGSVRNGRGKDSSTTMIKNH